MIQAVLLRLEDLWSTADHWNYQYDPRDLRLQNRSLVDLRTDHQLHPQVQNEEEERGVRKAQEDDR